MVKSKPIRNNASNQEWKFQGNRGGNNQNNGWRMQGKGRSKNYRTMQLLSLDEPQYR